VLVDIVPMRTWQVWAGKTVAPIALREAVPLIGLGFVFLNDQLPHPGLAAASLACVTIMPFLGARLRWTLVVAAGIGVFATLALVNLNGGISSPLRPVWLAVMVSSAFADALVALAVAAAGLAVVTPSLVGDGLHAAPVLTSAVVILALCITVTRSYARTVGGLEEQVATDSLTGVGNRFALDRRVEELFRSENPTGAFVFVDLDGFGEINHTRGHLEADSVLKAVAATLARVLPDDFVARAGGDEFALVLDRRRDPLDVARHVLRVITGAGPPGLKLTATAGVAYIPEDATRPDEARAAADRALRWGKADGKARAVRYDPQRAASRPEIGKNDVRRLWLEDRIRIHVQPIVDLKLGRVRGYEALARFNVDGDNTPTRLFSLAHSVGLRAQLELACLRQSLRLFEHRPSGTYLGVNLSPDLLELSAVHNILDALPDLDGLVLELTEDAVIEDYDRLSHQLATHVARGLQIAVDDFGAGQANLRHAWSILPAYLKLDRGLLSNLESDAARRALVASIVDYADDVGTSLVAEGVETTAELDAVLKLGVPYAQGFRLAPPGPPWPAIDAEALLADGFALSTPSWDPELLIVHAAETAGALHQRFAQNHRAMAAVLEDDDGKVMGLLTRNRLLVTLGTRFGVSQHAARSALEVADREFTSVRPGTRREEIVARVIGRDDSRRYDPILLLDGEGRLLGKLTVQDVLEPEIRVGVPPETRTRNGSRPQVTRRGLAPHESSAAGG
jgi:diguanylate cyclase (GGDEF)-like protein